MLTTNATAAAGTGFEGAVAGLTLPDLIQLKALSRFSGCLAVSCGENSGRIFFRDGEVIHAEQKDTIGESAFYRIATWPEGNFRTEPTVTTTSHTIHQSVNFLLLEAHRILDEGGQPAANATPATRQPNDLMDRLEDVAGLEAAVIATKDGIPVGDESADGESLAAIGTYAAVLARKLGGHAALGGLVSVATQGSTKNLLILEGKRHILTAALAATARLDVAETDIRQRMSRRQER